MSEISTVRGTWVQTERKAHESWALLIGSKPKAAQLLHLLVANMDKKGAIVISQKVLADLMSVHYNTVKKAIKVLKSDNWIDVIRIGSERGGVNAYVVNRRVAWADKRENQCYASFDARVITGLSEQEKRSIENTQELKQLPNLGEFQIPVGEGLAPPNQPSLPDMEASLPSVGYEVAEKDPEGDTHLQQNLPLG